jgi:hypothetical protein
MYFFGVLNLSENQYFTLLHGFQRIPSGIPGKFHGNSCGFQQIPSGIPMDSRWNSNGI